MVKVEDLKTLQTDLPCKDFLTVSVVNKSPVTKYGKEDKIMMTVVLADETGFVKALIYDPDKMGLLQENASCIVSNFIAKDGYIVINKPSVLYHGAPMKIPQDIMDAVQDFLTIKPMTVNETCLSPKKTTIQQVTGVITKVNSTELKRVRATGEEIPLKKIKIRDSTGDMDVCMWRGMASQTWERGDVVQLKNFSVTDTFNSVGAAVPALTNKDSMSTVQVLPPDTNYINLLKEEDEDDIDGLHNQPEGQIIGLLPIKTYRSCINDKCYRKQLKSLRCPTCLISYSEDSAGVSAVGGVLLKRKDENPISYTIFTQQLDSLSEQLEINKSFKDDTFVSTVQAKLPINIIYSSQGNKLTKLQVF